MFLIGLRHYLIVFLIKIIMIKFNKLEKGISIIGILLLGIILLLVLSYFKISVRSVVESPEAQDNISYVGGGTRNLWNDYLKQPATYLWNDIFVDIFGNLL